MIVIKDRLVAGAIAGIIGAIVQNIYGSSIKALGLTDRTFMDFSVIVLAGREFAGILGFVIGSLAHLAVGIIFGVIFAYLIMLTTRRYYMFKGLGFGLVLWFLLQGFGTIFNLSQFDHMPLNAAVTTLIGALIYGLVAAYTLRILDRRAQLL